MSFGGQLGTSTLKIAMKAQLSNVQTVSHYVAGVYESWGDVVLLDEWQHSSAPTLSSFMSEGADSSCAGSIPSGKMHSSTIMQKTES